MSFKGGPDDLSDEEWDRREKEGDELYTSDEEGSFDLPRTVEEYDATNFKTCVAIRPLSALFNGAAPALWPRTCAVVVLVSVLSPDAVASLLTASAMTSIS